MMSIPATLERLTALRDSGKLAIIEYLATPHRSRHIYFDSTDHDSLCYVIAAVPEFRFALDGDEDYSAPLTGDQIATLEALIESVRAQARADRERNSGYLSGRYICVSTALEIRTTI